MTLATLYGACVMMDIMETSLIVIMGFGGKGMMLGLLAQLEKLGIAQVLQSCPAASGSTTPANRKQKRPCILWDPPVGPEPGSVKNSYQLPPAFPEQPRTGRTQTKLELAKHVGGISIKVTSTANPFHCGSAVRFHSGTA